MFNRTGNESPAHDAALRLRSCPEGRGAEEKRREERHGNRRNRQNASPAISRTPLLWVRNALPHAPTTRHSIRQDMRASLQHDGKGPRCGTKALCRAFSARPCGKFRSTSMALPPLSQIFRPKTQARKTPVQTGQNALPGPRAVSLRGRASAMHAGFRGKRPTKPFPETQRCPFPGQPAETSMTKHPEGTGTGHRFLAPGCAQAEARPPRRERRGHTPERMFSRKRPCVLCGKIPLLPDDGENSAPQAFRQKNTGGELRPLSVPGRRSHRRDAQAQRPPPAPFLRA